MLPSKGYFSLPPPPFPPSLPSGFFSTPTREEMDVALSSASTFFSDMAEEGAAAAKNSVVGQMPVLTSPSDLMLGDEQWDELGVSMNPSTLLATPPPPLNSKQGSEGK